MLAWALVLFPAVVAALQTPAAPGKGFAKPAPAPPQAAGRTPLVSEDFLKWAEKSGIKTLDPIAVGEVAGERGVVASADFAAGARVLSVPSRLSLQVTSLTPCPRWCDEEVWKTSKWDARMAMLLLHEESEKRSALKPWLAQLPRTFATPVTWKQPADAFEAIGYRALATGVDRQRKEWDASRLRAPGSPSAKEWDWAMNVIRSRAFSGPYSPGTFIGSLTTLFGASTLAVAYALIVGGAGAADQAFDGFLLAVVFVLANDFVFGPRLATAKRYVLCPWIDFLNHDGNLGKSEVAYEYFADAFAARLDFDGGEISKGDQICISYGDRSNDGLLQYYGFVQKDNPHDNFAIAQEDLILAVNEVTTLPSDALPALKSAGLTDASALFTFNVQGADGAALRLGRLLLHPAAAAATDAGNTPLASNLEGEVVGVLAKVAEAQLSSLPSAATVDALPLAEDVPRATLVEFVAEKRRVLEASARALSQQAARV